MTEHPTAPPTCQHTSEDDTGAVLQCTRAATMVHTVHAGTAEGQPIRGFLFYCELHSPAHLNDPRTLAAGPIQFSGELTEREVLDELEAHLVPGNGS